MECQFKELERCPISEHMLDELLVSLPRSLDETYERMLSNITATSVGYAQRILTLLCCAKRPLTVPELIDGAAVELGDLPKFNPKRKLENTDGILQVCPGLIEVGMNTYGNESVVRIAHFSVQEYLESKRICQHKAAPFSVRRPDAHAKIACICLTYLLEPALLVLNVFMEKYPLTAYAARSWYEHYHDSDKNTYQIEHQALRLFRSSTGAFENWVRTGHIDDYRGEFISGKVASPTYYAALLGLDFIIYNLCRKPSGGPLSGLRSTELSDLVSTQEGYYRPTPQAALVTLDETTDVNAQGGRYGTALAAASGEGHEKIVELLLGIGAAVNAHGGGHYGTALAAASGEGHEKVVERLLGAGADVNAQGGNCSTALAEAAGGGHEKIVQRLLNAGAGVNADGGGHYGTALAAASGEGHEKIVELLLGAGAGVNAHGGDYYMTALSAASGGGHERIVKLLLSTGADVNAQGEGSYETALAAASGGGHEKIVERLLGVGAGVNVHGGGHYGTALAAASGEGHEKIVERLLGAGADVNAQGGYYSTALAAASGGGHEKIVEQLLSAGADVNVLGGGYYSTALAAASGGGGCEKIVERLLGAGARWR